MPKVFNRDVQLCGSVKRGVRVITRDNDGNVLSCSGTSVPTGAGYAKGCLFIKTDAATGTKGLYENQGTTASASFNVVGDIATAEIENGAVTLAKLATIISPSHVVKFVKLGSEITTTTLTGLAVGDLVIRFIVATSTVTAKLCATANTLPDDPADGDYIVVLRATS